MKRKIWYLIPASLSLLLLQTHAQEATEPEAKKEPAQVEKNDAGDKKPAADPNAPKDPLELPAPGAIPLPPDASGNLPAEAIAPMPESRNSGGSSSSLEIPFTRNVELLPVPLAGISLFADTRQAASEPAPQWEAGAKEQLLAGVQVVGGLNTPDPAGLRSELQSFINRNNAASFRDVQDMVDTIQKHYRKHNRPMTHVYIPRQSMYSDKVVIGILEGRVGEILILTEADLLKKDSESMTAAEKAFLARMNEEKNWWTNWYNNPYKAKDVAKEFLPRTQPLQGRVVDLEEIKAQVEGMNRNPWTRLNRPATHPFRDVNVSFSQPGANVLGTSNLVLEVDDKRPVRFFSGVDNVLTDITGENRIFFGAAWYDAFLLGKNHQLGMQFFSSLDPTELYGISVNYQIPWQNSKYDQFTEFFLSYADSNTTTTLGGVEIDVGGANIILGGRHYLELPEMFGATDLTMPVRRSRDQSQNQWGKSIREAMGLHHEIGAGFDFKMLDNTLEFGSTTVSDTPADIVQFVVEYNARQTDTTGESNLSAQLFLSPGGITGNNSDEKFLPLRADAEASYLYTRVRLEREQDLPFSGAFYGMMAKGSITAQYSSTNLMASEQIGLGGFGSARGYPERILRGDIGTIVNLELYSPDYHPLRDFFEVNKDETLNFLAFFDYAHGTSFSENPSDVLDDSASLMSAGLGFRYEFNNSLKVRFDYGMRLEDLPAAADDGESGRFHFGAFCTF